MSKFIDRTGETLISNKGEKFTIIKCRNTKDIDVMFEDSTIVTGRAYSDLKEGKITNPYTPSFFGVGYLGQGKYSSSIRGKHTKAYSIWKSMLGRCYSATEQEKYPTYKDVTVCVEWHNFQNFAEWFEENYKEGFALDKDILLKGNKIYKPHICIFVPQKINQLFTKANKVRGFTPIGVFFINGKYRAKLNRGNKTLYLGLFDTPEEAFKAYKIAKEAYIKEVADDYKDQITEQTYQALYNYQVEITD